MDNLSAPATGDVLNKGEKANPPTEKRKTNRRFLRCGWKKKKVKPSETKPSTPVTCQEREKAPAGGKKTPRRQTRRGAVFFFFRILYPISRSPAPSSAVTEAMRMTENAQVSVKEVGIRASFA